jgi:spore germination protein YaaH
MKRIAIYISIGFLSIALMISVIANIFLGMEVKDFQDSKFEKLNFVENYLLENDEISDLEAINLVEEQPKDNEELKISGWLPDWDYEDAVDAVEEYSDTFYSVSPFWFEIGEDGRIDPNSVANDQRLQDITNENDILLMPTITSFSAEEMKTVLRDEDNLNRHIDSILNQIDNNNYDGIDLDYESIYLKDKEKFYEMVQKLSTELIERNKKLSITVLPKWGDKDVVYLGFPETRKTFDYKRLSDMADEIRIMTYEYSGKSNKYFGPVGPLNWQEDVIKYAIAAGVPRDKIVLGTHLYSYDYSEREKLPNLEYYPVLKTEFDSNKPVALAYYNITVDEIFDEYSVETSYDEQWGEGIARYTNDDGTERILVYPSQQSIQDRKDLAARYGIRGIGYWRIGDEGSLNY